MPGDMVGIDPAGHTRVDHVPEDMQASLPRVVAGKVRCDACPVLCQISPGRTGACDRWGNVELLLVKTA